MKTAACKTLGIEVPIVQAPMEGAVGPRLAAAVSNAGGLGMLVPWASDIEVLRREVRETRALTSKPFAVNLNLNSLKKNAWTRASKKAFPSSHSSGRTRPRSLPGQRPEARLCCTPLRPPKARKRPSGVASMRLSPRDGKPEVT